MIQILGRSKCSATRKAKRFFSERGIPFQDMDLKSHGISAGELNNIARSVALEKLIDEEGQFYRKGGYQWRVFDPAEEILEHSELLRTPIVRNKHMAVCGDDPDGWEALARQERS